MSTSEEQLEKCIALEQPCACFSIPSPKHAVQSQEVMLTVLQKYQCISQCSLLYRKTIGMFKIPGTFRTCFSLLTSSR